MDISQKEIVEKVREGCMDSNHDQTRDLKLLTIT
jgi:hypothetical protein